MGEGISAEKAYEIHQLFTVFVVLMPQTPLASFPIWKTGK